MTNDTIIAEWKFGKRKETIQALAIVEPIIFDYQTKIMKGE